MADGCDRSLSDLPDDLLRHILFFAPAREGATTAVLSRRWRWLWRTSGAVNLDSRSFRHPRSSDAPFLRGAEKALSAAQDPIRRLTLFVPEGSEINRRPSRRRRRRLCEDGSPSDSDRSLIESLLSNPAARLIEELRIEVENVLHTPGMLCLDSLPSEALQILRIVNCSPRMAAPTPPPLPGAAAARFTRLADLHLHGCDVSIEDLGNTIAAAPQLSTLHLQSSYVYSKPPRDDAPSSAQFDIEIFSVWCPILCPAVTALVLADCTFGYARHRYGGQARLAIHFDVPRLQYFRYEGSVVVLTSRLWLKQYVSNDMIRQVDLRLTYTGYDHLPLGRQICELFWGFVQSFNTTRRLKLKLELLMDELVFTDKAIKDGLLGSLSFCRLEELQLEGQYEPGTTSMALLADLLRCCPVVRDLRLKFSKAELPQSPMRSSINKDEADDEGDLEIQEHLNPSVKRWKAGEHAMDIPLQHDDNYMVYGIPGFTSEHPFSCLHSHLKRVSLDFHMDARTCLGVKLAKFFAENAMVLEEIQVDDSGQEMLEHLDPSVRRLVAANIGRSTTK